MHIIVLLIDFLSMCQISHIFTRTQLWNQGMNHSLKMYFPNIHNNMISSSKRELETINGNSQDQDKDGKVEPRRREREMTEKSFSPGFLTYVLEGDPQTFKEAVNFTESLMWKETIKSEIDFILHNHT